MRMARGMLPAVAMALALVGVSPSMSHGAGHSVTLFAGVFGNDEFVQVWEGVAGSYAVHDRVSLVGRITGVHYLDSSRFREGDSGIGEAGVGVLVAPRTTVTILGGSYFGDIEDPIIDGWVSTSQLIAGHWFQLNVGALYGFDSERWQTWNSLSTPITDTAKDLILFGGVESVIYSEGELWDGGDFVHNSDKDDVRYRVGPFLELYKRSWDAGVRVGVGGGDYGVYGSGQIYKRFGFGS